MSADKDADASMDLLVEGLWTVKEACAFLKMSNSAVYSLMQRRELPFAKIDGCRRIPVVAVKRLVLRGLFGA